MAIIRTAGRPAIDIIQDSYTLPPGDWATRLGEASTRKHLQTAIPAVGRIDYVGHPNAAFGGTAFVVGPDLLMSCGVIRQVAELKGDGYLFRPGMSAMADFRREVIPTEPAYVKIEEVLYVDPRCKVELLRAKLPSNITPLRLSVSHPHDLSNRDVALIGYPAMDSRSERKLVEEIFGAVYDVKRLLPGRLDGYEKSKYGEFLALRHDCTTMGGCGGAPLIDLDSGEVVGIHFAGSYLLANYAVPSWEVARDPVFAARGVLFAGPLPAPISPEPVAETSSRPVGNLSEASVEKISIPSFAPDDLTVEEIEIFDQIVLAERPAFVVEAGRPKLEGVWEPILKQHEARLSLAIRAVGKICLAAGSVPWVGTAFIVGNDLAMTASYTVREFASGSSSNVTLKPGIQPTIDFSDALGLPSSEATARIVGVRFIHPFFDVALLELDQVPAGAAALNLAGQVPSNLADRQVVVLSFVGEDSGEPADMQKILYGKQWGRLFVQPGLTMQMGQTPGRENVPALTHDCSTTVGSAGAPVVDLDTGYVIGVHTHAEYLMAGYAQPTWELARDPHVWDHPIRFRPQARPSWLGAWEDPLPVSNPPVVRPEPRPERWTVDKTPIDFQLEEPRKLERLLFDTVDKESARYFAENAGVPLGLVDIKIDGKFFWRELLKTVSGLGLLRKLIEEIANGQVDIKPRLGEFL